MSIYIVNYFKNTKHFSQKYLKSNWNFSEVKLWMISEIHFIQQVRFIISFRNKPRTQPPGPLKTTWGSGMCLAMCSVTYHCQCSNQCSHCWCQAGDLHSYCDRTISVLFHPSLSSPEVQQWHGSEDHSVLRYKLSHNKHILWSCKKGIKYYFFITALNRPC